MILQGRLNNSIWAFNIEVIKLAGCEISNNSVEITMSDNGSISNKKIEIVEKIYMSIMNIQLR